MTQPIGLLTDAACELGGDLWFMSGRAIAHTTLALARGPAATFTQTDPALRAPA